MARNFEKLKRLLAELFQLDQADLDFGIFRIMNQKRQPATAALETLHHGDARRVVRDVEGHTSRRRRAGFARLDDMLAERVRNPVE